MSQVSSQNQNLEPVVTDEFKLHKEKFNVKLKEMFDNGQLYKTYTREKYEETIRELQLAKSGGKKDNLYYLLNQYDVITIDKSQRLIKKKTDTGFQSANVTVVFYAYLEEFFELILSAHRIVGHGGQKKTKRKLGCKYGNIGISVVKLFCQFCQGYI